MKKRDWRRLLVCTACLSFAIGLSSSASSSSEERSTGDRSLGKPRAFDIYTGLEPTRVRSTSRVEGAKGEAILGPVLQGDFVHHRFLIPNPTDETILVRLPKVCSGCILESYSKQIGPGLDGAISIVIPTDALGGQTVEGTVTVETSLPDRAKIEIDVKLVVRAFAKLSSYRVWLEGKASDDIVETCIVIPSADYPFEITAIRARKGVWFSHDFEAIEQQGQKGYRITIRNTRKKPGNYQDVLFVQTDHPDRPEFKIRLEGRIQE